MSILSWIGDLSTGILASIIATIIVTLFIGINVTKRIKRKSNLTISFSEIAGDVVIGDKGHKKTGMSDSFEDQRVSTTAINNSKIQGDVVQGDKEV